jgi:hypothetical protein
MSMPHLSYALPERHDAFNARRSASPPTLRRHAAVEAARAAQREATRWRDIMLEPGYYAIDYFFDYAIFDTPIFAFFHCRHFHWLDIDAAFADAIVFIFIIAASRRHFR